MKWREGIKGCVFYQGVGKLVIRHIWDVESVSSSLATLTRGSSFVRSEKGLTPHLVLYGVITLTVKRTDCESVDASSILV